MRKNKQRGRYLITGDGGSILIYLHEIGIEIGE